MSARSDLPYLAGLFDGEGTISLGRRGRGVGLKVMVEMTDREGVDAFAQCFGGKTKILARRTKGRRIIYRWTATGQSASGPLRRLLPYLRVKHEQAQVALEYLAWWGVGHQGIRSTELQKVRENEFHSELKRLKVPGETLEQGDDKSAE